MGFYVLFLALVFFDGCMVAFANVVDIDCGGTDIVGSQVLLVLGACCVPLSHGLRCVSITLFVLLSILSLRL